MGVITLSRVKNIMFYGFNYKKYFKLLCFYRYNYKKYLNNYIFIGITTNST